jgi:hypothetical protein
MKNLILINFILIFFACDNSTGPAPAEQKPYLTGVYYYQDDKTFISYTFNKNGTYGTISNFEESHIEGHGTYILKENELCLTLKTYCFNDSECEESTTGQVCSKIKKTTKTLVFYVNDSIKTTYEKAFE